MGDSGIKGWVEVWKDRVRIRLEWRKMEDSGMEVGGGREGLVERR